MKIVTNIFHILLIVVHSLEALCYVCMCVCVRVCDQQKHIINKYVL